MTVLVVQHNDGGQSGSETPVPPLFAGQTDRDLLDRKAASHEARGWVIQWHGQSSFDAHREFPEGKWCRSKDRRFRIR